MLDELRRLTKREDRLAAFPNRLGEIRIWLAGVPAAEQQDRGPRHGRNTHAGCGDVGRLRVVHPQNAADVRHGLEPVRQGLHASQARRNAFPRIDRSVGGVGGGDCQRGREGIADVVIA
jgi:predicted nucleic acid-binding Zn ribbon protein